MPDVIPCAPACCVTTPPVNVPGIAGEPGTDGEPGAPGADGENAFTITTADFIVPVVGADVVVQVESTAWMAEGMNVVVDGPASFQASIDSATQLTLTFLGYINDVAPGTTISAGAKITATGDQASFDLANGEQDGAGADYSLTNAYAPVVLGTGQLDMALPSAGTYVLNAQIATSVVTNGDALFFKFRNSTDSSDVPGSEIEWDKGSNSGIEYAFLMSHLTVAAPKTIQVWAVNSTFARGIVNAIYSKTTFLKVSNT